jgi:hypothetical protein
MILDYRTQPIGSIPQFREGESRNFRVENPGVSEPTTRSFTEFILSELRCFASLSMTSEGFRVTTLVCQNRWVTLSVSTCAVVE